MEFHHHHHFCFVCVCSLCVLVGANIGNWVHMAYLMQASAFFLSLLVLWSRTTTDSFFLSFRTDFPFLTLCISLSLSIAHRFMFLCIYIYLGPNHTLTLKSSGTLTFAHSHAPISTNDSLGAAFHDTLYIFIMYRHYIKFYHVCSRDTTEEYSLLIMIIIVIIIIIQQQQ